jgi:hypothetical protein
LCNGQPDATDNGNDDSSSSKKLMRFHDEFLVNKVKVSLNDRRFIQRRTAKQMPTPPDVHKASGSGF